MSETDDTGIVDLSDMCNSDDPQTGSHCTLPESSHDGRLVQHEHWREGKLQSRWVE
jgi:hypothetical protein